MKCIRSKVSNNQGFRGIVLLIPFAIFLNISCRKQIIEKYPNGSIKAKNEICYPYDKCIFDGKSQLFYENGQLQIEANYKGGKVNGVVRSFYPSGVKFGKKIMKDNKKNGYDSIWFENGNLNLAAHYKNDKLDGMYQQYNTDGKYITLTSYKNGLEDGIRNVWEKDGRKLEAEIHNGVLHGFCKTFSKDGRLTMSGLADSGKPCGTAFFYDSSGAVQEKIEHTYPCANKNVK